MLFITLSEAKSELAMLICITGQYLNYSLKNKLKKFGETMNDCDHKATETR